MPLFTRKRVRRIALISGALFVFALALGGSMKAGIIPDSLINPVEITFNLSAAVSILLFMYGVAAPVSMTIHYNASQNEWLRHRVRNHIIFRQFIMEKEGQENE